MVVDDESLLADDPAVLRVRKEDAAYGARRAERAHLHPVRAAVACADDDATLLLLSPNGEIAQPVPLAELEDDRFWSVAVDASNLIYAAGFIDAGGDSRMIVARFTPDGVLDPSFGTGGVAGVNLIAAGTGEVARGITLQSDGKIVIAGTVEAAAAMP